VLCVNILFTDTQYSVVLWCAASEPIVTERPALEVELKGICESYNVVIEPSVLLVPGQIIQDTVIRRKFKVVRSHTFYTESQKNCTLFVVAIMLCNKIKKRICVMRRHEYASDALPLPILRRRSPLTSPPPDTS